MRLGSRGHAPSAASLPGTATAWTEAAGNCMRAPDDSMVTPLASWLTSFPFSFWPSFSTTTTSWPGWGPGGAAGGAGVAAAGGEAGPSARASGAARARQARATSELRAIIFMGSAGM